MNRHDRRRAARLGDFALGACRLVGRLDFSRLAKDRPQLGRMRDRWVVGMRCAACDSAIDRPPAGWAVVDCAGLVMIAGVCARCAACPDVLRAILDEIGLALGGRLRAADPAAFVADGGRA
jgi:hypothetical protein